MTIQERINSLRSFMQSKGLAAFIVPSTDPHSGEYVPSHWESRKWLTGFTGSAGTAVITLDQGGLWTDSRYFLQAAEQLSGSGITLFKDRLPDTPSVAEWLGEVLRRGDDVGIDGAVNSTEDAERLQLSLGAYRLNLRCTEDPFRQIWKDRPALPLNPPSIFPLRYAGKSCADKVAQVREYLHAHGIEGILLSALDEIAWTLNLRGNDVHCNPVFISYLLITEKESILYIAPGKLTTEIKAYLAANHVAYAPYGQIEADMKRYGGKNIQLSGETNYALYRAAVSATTVLKRPSPVQMLKAIKNETEVKGFHEAMKRDGIAMVRFLIWLEEAVRSGAETETSIDRKLYGLRAGQTDFQGISFDTIAGYQAHGAIVHYEATPESAYALKPEGLLLIDSGAHYLDGTTDITRTLALGPLTREQQADYTLVLKGFIALSKAEFPEGTCGTQLDVLARQFMWQAGINYGHGTGHGVGHFLNVHEGPHQIRMNHVPSPLLPGMTVTNEPGIYRAGRYGIRIENSMLVVKGKETEFGTFYKFEPLTLCPIDKKGILVEMLSPEEKEWLNGYHLSVYKVLSPMLEESERKWLQDATSPVR